MNPRWKGPEIGEGTIALMLILVAVAVLATLVVYL